MFEVDVASGTSVCQLLVKLLHPGLVLGLDSIHLFKVEYWNIWVSILNVQHKICFKTYTKLLKALRTFCVKLQFFSLNTLTVRLLRSYCQQPIPMKDTTSWLELQSYMGKSGTATCGSFDMT